MHFRPVTMDDTVIAAAVLARQHGSAIALQNSRRPRGRHRTVPGGGGLVDCLATARRRIFGQELLFSHPRPLRCRERALTNESPCMKITIDTEAATLTGEDGTTRDLFSAASFEEIARLWVNVGWVRQYSYAFSWMGRPIIQLPDDMVRTQEAIFATRPDVIVETGVAHGGSLVFYASLFAAMDHGRVIGIDIDIRPHNRAAIEAHPMFPRISLIEGSSTADETIMRVREQIAPGERVMVFLDSDHSRDHVAAELARYAPLVSPGCFLLVQDGVMEHVAGMPRTGEDWSWNNPKPATAAFLDANPEFEHAPLRRPFDESQAVPDCSHHPYGWLRRKP